MKEFYKFLGAKLYGFCNGYFGRSSYEDKIVEAVGLNWVVVRDEDGHFLFTTFKTAAEMFELLERWQNDEDVENEEEKE